MNQLREDWSADWLLWNPMNQSGQTQGQATESTIVALAALEPSETMIIEMQSVLEEVAERGKHMQMLYMH